MYIHLQLLVFGLMRAAFLGTGWGGVDEIGCACRVVVPKSQPSLPQKNLPKKPPNLSLRYVINALLRK